MGGFDIIMIGNFYQALPIWDLWIFKFKKLMNLNILWTIIWHENIKCYDLIQWLMWQNNLNFINI
jgi:hypothetical protein